MVTLMIGGLVVVGGLVRSKLYYDYLSGLFTDKEGESKEHGNQTSYQGSHLT